MPTNLRTISEPNCKLCETEGEVLYTGLKDFIGTTHGDWGFNRCKRCGLIWLDPMPDMEDLSLAYAVYPTHESDEMAYLSLKEKIRAGYLRRRYGFKGGNDLNPIYHYLGYLLWLMPLKRVSTDFWFKALGGMDKKGRLLDIGCGNGSLIRLMNEWGWQAEGIEPDHHAFKIASSMGLKVVNGDFLESNFDDESYDAVISNHVLEHVYDPVGFLKKCYRIVKPNGIICIATPNASSWQHLLFKRHWMALDPPRHFYLFSPESMRLCAQMAGVQDYRISTTTRGSRFIASASLMIKHKGSYHWHDRTEFKTSLISNLLEILEYFLLNYNKDRGVELLFTAFKR
ncbi:MAG: class I SAM-dependent methyltransferase [Thermodesulfovibrionales bacterium]